MTDASTDIRPFQPGDRTAFQNAQAPAHLQETVAEGELHDLLRPAGDAPAALCWYAADSWRLQTPPSGRPSARRLSAGRF